MISEEYKTKLRLIQRAFEYQTKQSTPEELAKLNSEVILIILELLIEL